MTPVYSKVSGKSNHAGNLPASNAKNFPTPILGEFVRPQEKTKGGSSLIPLPALAHLGMLHIYLEP